MNNNSKLISLNEAKKLGATCLARRNENGQLEAIISLDNVPTVKTYCYYCGQTEHGKIVPDALQGWRYEEKPKETSFRDYLEEQLKDPEFRKEWEKLCEEEESGADIPKPNCVTCDHFGECDGCERKNEE